MSCGGAWHLPAGCRVAWVALQSLPSPTAMSMSSVAMLCELFVCTIPFGSTSNHGHLVMVMSMFTNIGHRFYYSKSFMSFGPELYN